jgi:hypothetical protein
LAKRSDVAAHIVRRVDKARQLDSSLTIKQATQELGISESSYYKLRAGTRSGHGSIRARVMRPVPFGTLNVKFEGEGRASARNIRMQGLDTQADALVARHDKARMGRELKKIVREEGRAAAAREKSPPWTARQRAVLRVTEVRIPQHIRARAYVIRGEAIR